MILNKKQESLFKLELRRAGFRKHMYESEAEVAIKAAARKRGAKGKRKPKQETGNRLGKQ